MDQQAQFQSAYKRAIRRIYQHYTEAQTWPMYVSIDEQWYLIDPSVKALERLYEIRSSLDAKSSQVLVLLPHESDLTYLRSPQRLQRLIGVCEQYQALLADHRDLMLMQTSQAKTARELNEINTDFYRLWSLFSHWVIRDFTSQSEQLV